MMAHALACMKGHPPRWNAAQPPGLFLGAPFHCLYFSPQGGGDSAQECLNSLLLPHVFPCTFQRSISSRAWIFLPSSQKLCANLVMASIWRFLWPNLASNHSAMLLNSASSGTSHRALAVALPIIFWHQAHCCSLGFYITVHQSSKVFSHSLMSSSRVEIGANISIWHEGRIIGSSLFYTVCCWTLLYLLSQHCHECDAFNFNNSILTAIIKYSETNCIRQLS